VYGTVVSVVAGTVSPVTGSMTPPPVVGDTLEADDGTTAMPTIGLVSAPVGWPRSAASPKAARPPSAATAQ